MANSPKREPSTDPDEYFARLAEDEIFEPMPEDERLPEGITEITLFGDPEEGAPEK